MHQLAARGRNGMPYEAWISGGMVCVHLEIPLDGHIENLL